MNLSQDRWKHLSWLAFYVKFYYYLVGWEGEKFFRRDAFGQCVLLTRRRNAADELIANCD